MDASWCKAAADCCADVAAPPAVPKALAEAANYAKHLLAGAMSAMVSRYGTPKVFSIFIAVTPRLACSVSCRLSLCLAIIADRVDLPHLPGCEGRSASQLHEATHWDGYGLMYAGHAVRQWSA